MIDLLKFKHLLSLGWGVGGGGVLILPTCGKCKVSIFILKWKIFHKYIISIFPSLIFFHWNFMWQNMNYYF